MTDFPMDISIFNKIVEVFNQTRSYILLLFPLAFFIRIAFGFILLRSDDFINILKDSLFLFLGLFFFTDILKLTLQIPYFVSSELSFGEWKNINLGDGIFTRVLKRIVDWIGILAYWISFGLYIVIISILGFFAGYILFFGTMFRAYGLLKLFFVLLFTASLWPLLWHSINFAAYTIAVSDNALANNVVIGGASLAKVVVPLWIISKTSKLPVAQTLKKVSLTGGSLSLAGGSLAYSGGSYAYSSLNDKVNNFFENRNIQNEEEITSEESEINITDNSFEENDYLDQPIEDFSFQEREETEDFKEEAPEEEETHIENSLNQEEKQSLEEIQENKIENNISQENSIEEQVTQQKQEVHIEQNPQSTEEVKTISQNYNESILNESQNLENKDFKETNYSLFNEAIHREDWIEEEEENSPPRKKEKEKDIDL